MEGTASYIRCDRCWAVLCDDAAVEQLRDSPCEWERFVPDPLILPIISRVGRGEERRREERRGDEITMT